MQSSFSFVASVGQSVNTGDFVRAETEVIINKLNYLYCIISSKYLPCSYPSVNGKQNK